ncbi:MAG: riboflavin synthase [Candidatus Zixiibacteriota bacterium]|nr:MAG: riboflavin synthase [candidate division Zixibacteria bacterium]
MFTGIIQEIGIVKFAQKKGDSLLIQIESPKSSKLLKVGGSININGACQSAIKISPVSSDSGSWFEVQATSETISRTNFKFLQAGDRVNLELPLSLNDPLGGHLVTGHIDDTGRITDIKPSGGSILMRIVFKPEYNCYLVEKGSVAIDGISLTVFDVETECFTISLIPETIERTNLKFRNIGDVVNLEFDQIGKYIEKFMKKDGKGLTMDFLKRHGF